MSLSICQRNQHPLAVSTELPSPEADEGLGEGLEREVVDLVERGTQVFRDRGHAGEGTADPADDGSDGVGVAAEVGRQDRRPVWITAREYEQGDRSGHGVGGRDAGAGNLVEIA